MNIGMLWYDNDSKTNLESKISRAAIYYHEKYGDIPNLCFVHPSMVSVSKDMKPIGIEVRTTLSVLPNHLWLGVNSGNVDVSGV